MAQKYKQADKQELVNQDRQPMAEKSKNKSDPKITLIGHFL